VLAATIQNTGTDDLQNYVVAVPVDNDSFNFAVGARDGSDLAVWDANTKSPISFWLESYDSQIGKALLWVKTNHLAPQASQTVLITAGAIPHCAGQASDGYAVFPFFSDVHDVHNWTTENHLSLTDTVTTSPFTIQDRQVIESDGTYNADPGLAEAGNGDWVLTYRKGTDHVDVPLIILRRSQDKGKTWGPEVAYFDTSGPDPALARAPDGDLILVFDKPDLNNVTGAVYGRSVDNGLTWGPFTFFSQPADQIFGFVPAFFTNGSAMYAASYGTSTFDTNESPYFLQSTDDGNTWTKVSEMRKLGEPGLDETSVTQVGEQSLFAMMRADDSINTYGSFSADLGQTWGPVISYTRQVGVVQDPILISARNVLVLLGRQSLLSTTPSNPSATTRQLVAFTSDDGGHTFNYGTILDTYTGTTIDGGYSWPLLLSDGSVYVVYYADSNNLRKPDIKSLRLTIQQPSITPTNALHAVSQFDRGHASRNLNLSATRYSVDLRFRSQQIAGGSQFSVILAGNDTNDVSRTLVDWELPSVHSSDPTSISGFFADGQFVPFTNSFAYGQSYRLRMIVDEKQQQQEGQMMDQFGAVVKTGDLQPFAQQGASAHVSSVTIGNDSNLRSTDTLLDFIFVRQAVTMEPGVAISRLH